MKLRNKVLIAIGIAWGVLLAITALTSYYFLLGSFLKLESDNVHKNLYRVTQALNQNLYSLSTFTTDWAQWNDAYTYMQGINPDFVPNNLLLSAFITSSINFIGYYHTNGSPAYEAAADLDKKQLVSPPAALKKYIYPDSLLLQHKNTEHALSGYLGLPSGIMMVSTSIILKGDRTGPPLGNLITGRYLSPQIIQKISDTIGLKVQLYLPQQYSTIPGIISIYQDSLETNDSHLQIVNNNLIRGYSIIRDIYNHPIGLIQIEVPRVIYQGGLETIFYYLTSFLVLGVLLTLLLWWLLHKLIIKRLEHLDQQIYSIGSKQRLSQRVDVDGDDELSSVATKVNAMLTNIQASHDELENRVEQRTHELQETNIRLKQEVTERAAVEKDLLIHKEHLAHLAHYDSLTGLPNRVLFNDMLNMALSRAKRHNKKLALFFIDLDRFKNINDALGHHIGDEVIKQIAQRFKNNLRTEDVVARLGGDEFILLIQDFENQQKLTHIINKLLNSIDKAIVIGDREFFISASLGVCIYPDDGDSLEILQKNADMAMYKAKKSGGHSFHFYTAEMDKKARQVVELETNLRKAITNKELVIFYQPKYNLPEKNICGIEALVRWICPEIGIIPPSDFIPLAEETGLILQIGAWVLKEACKQVKTWQEAGYQPLSVAVNLSAVQFRHPNLVEEIAHILKETQLAPQYLELEITESAIMENVETAISKLNAIKEMGIAVSIDDFGTGYSSISYLKQFPITILKIDQAFIKGIPQNQKDMSITSAINMLAHSLGLKVIAEGVETVEQLNYLVEIGCDMVQGYLFSKPVPAEKIISLFKIKEFLKANP